MRLTVEREGCDAAVCDKEVKALEADSMLPRHSGARHLCCRGLLAAVPGQNNKMPLALQRMVYALLIHSEQALAQSPATLNLKPITTTPAWH